MLCRAPLTWALFLWLACPVLAGESVELMKENRLDRDVLRLTLSSAVASSWRDANVSKVAIRSAGAQRRLTEEQLTPSADLELSVAEEGCYVVLIDVGPASSKGFADSWRRVSRCTKIVECSARGDATAQLTARRSATSFTTAKVGSRVEIRPLLSPTLVRPGGDFPLRLYAEGKARQGARVEAHGPEGQTVNAVTDPVGIATLRIPSSGRWNVFYRHRQDGSEVIAELIFDVLPQSFWATAEGDLR